MSHATTADVEWGLSMAASGSRRDSCDNYQIGSRSHHFRLAKDMRRRGITSIPLTVVSGKGFIGTL